MKPPQSRVYEAYLAFTYVIMQLLNNAGLQYKGSQNEDTVPCLSEVFTFVIFNFTLQFPIVGKGQNHISAEYV